MNGAEMKKKYDALIKVDILMACFFGIGAVIVFAVSGNGKDNYWRYHLDSSYRDMTDFATVAGWLLLLMAVVDVASAIYYYCKKQEIDVDSVMCQGCKRMISKDAEQCPHCGKKMNTGFSEEIKTGDSRVNRGNGRKVIRAEQTPANPVVSADRKCPSCGCMQRSDRVVCYRCGKEL